MDRDAEALKAAAKTLGGASDILLLIAADVSDEADAARYVRATVDRFGSIDVLFSNAGNFGTIVPIQDCPVEMFDAVYAVHVRGAFLAAKYTVPHMALGGSIIITSSVAGQRGNSGDYAYITAKHAQTGLKTGWVRRLAATAPIFLMRLFRWIAMACRMKPPARCCICRPTKAVLPPAQCCRWMVA